MRARKLIVALAAVPLILAGTVGNAVADIIENTINVEPPVASISEGGSVSVGYRVQSQNLGTDGQQGCNAADTTPLTLTLQLPQGVSATGSTLKPGNQLVFTQCGQPQTLSFSASTAGDYPIGVTYQDGGVGSYTNDAAWTLKVTAPVPTNTKPTVAVTGVTDGASYEIGSVPTAMCAASDVEDGNSTFPAVVTGTLVHQLGSLTATCDWTDSGQLAADTARATYSVVDTGNPTISHSLSAEPNGKGWFADDVTVTFTCADEGGSGIKSCVAGNGPGDSQTFGEGGNQSVTGTATDWADNTATDPVTGINVDKTAPTNLSFVGGPVNGGRYYPNNVPAAPTCTAQDALSGVDTCVVTGWSTALGQHTLTATATDKAGNQTQVTGPTYTVRQLTLNGFYAPVDMGNVFNTVKAGATVPLKFEVFDEGVEVKDVARIQGLTTKTVSCTTGTSEDAIEELATTGGTSLRFDTTGDQFIQNWKTPSQSGKCYEVRMTTEDGSWIKALFKLK